jgi:hypothetical protein
MVGGAMVAVGAFLPWVTLGLLSIDGMRGDGIFALLLGIGIVVPIAGTYSNGPSRSLRWFVLLLGALSAALYVWKLSDISALGGDSVVNVQPGTGLFVGGLGGLIVVLFSAGLAEKVTPKPPAT